FSHRRPRPTARPSRASARSGRAWGRWSRRCPPPCTTRSWRASRICRIWRRTRSSPPSARHGSRGAASSTTRAAAIGTRRGSPPAGRSSGVTSRSPTGRRSGARWWSSAPPSTASKVWSSLATATRSRRRLPPRRRSGGAGAGLGDGARATIDCGNSGTTVRLGAGLAAGARGAVVLDGDASLRRRPMERVAEPLRRMGAEVATTDGHAPVTVRGGRLTAIEWALPVPSAQVKSAVLLAGLRARGTTRVREPLPSRDHTERLLPVFGAEVARERDGVAVAGGQRLRAAEVTLPGDASSAAFLVVAALLVPGSELRLVDVGVNPSRLGHLEMLRRMGATIDVVDVHEQAG